MENQMNVGNQNSQQIWQNPVSQPIITPEKPKTNYLLIGGAVLASFVVFGFGGYYLGKQSSNTQAAVQDNNLPEAKETITPTQSNYATTTPSTVPSFASNWKTYTTNNQMDINDSFFQKFPNFKNDIPTKLTFQYPGTWEIFKINSSPYQKTILLFSLHKNDPRFANCKSEGPCENFADIQLRIGMTDSTIQDFDNNFWGAGYPIERKNATSVNGVEVVQAFNTNTSQFPMGSLYKIAPNAQLNVTSEFFNFNDQNNEADYSKQTIQEINQILSTFKFTK